MQKTIDQTDVIVVMSNTSCLYEKKKKGVAEYSTM